VVVAAVVVVLGVVTGTGTEIKKEVKKEWGMSRNSERMETSGKGCVSNV